MKVGCVKEIKSKEFRVGMTPAAAQMYVEAGHEVIVEKGLGLGSGFDDREYEAVGARLIGSAREVWNTADMLIKVKEPLPQEYELFREDLILYTYLHLAADKPQTDALIQAKVKGVAYETLIDRSGTTPLLAPMSQIAGRLSVQEGAKYLEKTYGGAGVLLAGVPGTPKGKVVILGGGVVGTNACKIAVGMGAEVSILDISLQRLAYLDDIFGARINTVVSNEANIENEIKDADVVVGAVLIPGKAAPKIFQKKHLSLMKPGAVFVDVAVDQGGCGETTRVTYHNDPVYEVDGIIHYCVGNMPGAVPRTSTIALNNATLPFGLKIANLGLEEACRQNEILYSAINTYAGKLTHAGVAEAFDDYHYTDIKTLIEQPQTFQIKLKSGDYVYENNERKNHV